LNKLQLPKIPNVYQYWQPILEKHWLPYYQSLVEREKRVLLFAAVVLPIMVLVFAIILPLNDARHNKQLTLNALQQQVSEAESLVARLQEKGGVQGRESVISKVDQVARVSKVRQFMTRLRPQIGSNGGQRLLVQMRDVPYDKTVVFFEALSRAGLLLMQVKLQHAELQGYIHVQAIIE